MKKSTSEDRQKWPVGQYPHWNKMMDYIDGQIDSGLVDLKLDLVFNSTRSLEEVAEEFMRMVQDTDQDID